MKKIIAFLLSLMITPITPLAAHAETHKAVFAGGCFWCMESEYKELAGINAVISGYVGQGNKAPTYDEVSTGTTGFKEAVEITYAPSLINYTKLLSIFWDNVDPFDAEGQFCDKGSQYVAAIFYANEAEKQLAEESLQRIEKKYNKKVATQILPQSNFFPAEEYHQDYYKKNPTRYKQYRAGCGRDSRLEELKKEAP